MQGLTIKPLLSGLGLVGTDEEQEAFERAQRAALSETLRRGILSEEVWRDLKREIDARLIEGQEEGWEQFWLEDGLRIPEEDVEQEDARTMDHEGERNG